MPRFEELVPAALAIFALVALTASHWLQLPDQALTVLTGVVGAATTLYFVNKHRDTPTA